MADVVESQGSTPPPAPGGEPGSTAAGSGSGRDSTLTETAQGCLPAVQQALAVRASGEMPAAGPNWMPLRVVDSSDYVIEAEAGRGGVGIVYRARDRRLGRVVAVKELQKDDPTARLRFEREMRITARLQHPGVVPVHEAGRWPTGEPFYAMKLVEGSSLKARVAEAPTLAARLALLPSLIAVAETMAYAHAHKVTHRDLKPANVIIGAYGETVVIDWGLAKEVDEPDAFADTLRLEPYRELNDSGTRVGTIVGTPAYMPPEQASGAPVDQRADVYALGAMLYHLLTGASPYADAVAASADVLARVLVGPPRPIDALVPGAPRELVAIADKAMARAPGARYPSAGQLAEELRRFQTGQLVDAYRYSRRDLVGRWMRRNRGVALTASLALLLLMAMGAASLARVIHESARADRERDQAIRQRELAERAERTARRTANEVILAHAAGDVARDPTMAIAWLKRLTPLDADVSRAHAIALAALSRPVASKVWTRWKLPLSRLVFSPDGATLLVAAVGDSVSLIDVASGTERRRWPIDTEPTFLTASSDRRRVAFLETQYQVAVVDIDDGQLTRPEGCPGPVASTALAPDGRQLVCVRAGAAARVIDLRSGRVVDWPGSASWPTTASVAWADDGEELYAATGSEPAVLTFAPRSGTTRRLALPDARAPVVSVLAASPTQLFVTTRDGRVALVDRDTGGTRWLPGGGEASIQADASARAGVVVFRHAGEPAYLVKVATGQVQALPASCHGRGTPTLSPSGRYAVVPCADDWFLLWDDVHAQAWPLRGHGDDGPVAFSPAEDWVATSGSDGAVRLWRVPAAAPLLARHAGVSYHVVPAGPWIVTDSVAGTVAVIDAATWQARTFPIAHDMVYALAAGDGGRVVAAGSWDGQIVLWHTGSFDTPAQLIGARGHPIWGLAFDDTGGLLGDARTDGAHLWPVGGGPAVALAGHEGEVRAIQLGRLGGEPVALTGGEDGTVRLWALDGKPLRVWHGHTRMVQQVRFAGTQVVSGSDDGTVRLWDGDRDRGKVIARHDTFVRALSVSPTQRFVASAATDGSVSVYDRDSGATVTLAAERGAVRTLEFDADERTLLSSSMNGTLWRWSWQSGEVCVLLQSGGLNGAAWVGHGTSVVTAGTTGEIRRSSSQPTACLTARPESWSASLAAITQAEATPARGGKE